MASGSTAPATPTAQMGLFASEPVTPPVLAAMAELLVLTAWLVGSTLHDPVKRWELPPNPAELLASQELDIYPKFRPELAELIEGSIGAESMFHGTYGYYADGVGPETAKLPRDWEARALKVQAPTTGMATAICPEANDLVANFVRDKIRSIVKNPVIAEKLCPFDHPIGTRRLVVDTGYYETYNRPNVTLVDVKESAIRRTTRTGIE